MKKIIIGVMGPGEKATAVDLKNAYELGKLIAQSGWVLLTGGRNVGVMNAASQGAKSVNGLTVGILPDANQQAISEAVDIAIFTDMGNARNNINVLSSDVVIACGLGAGTVSEVALALKGKKQVILLSDDEQSKVFFKNLSPENIYVVESAKEAIATAQAILNTNLGDC
ncbi:TIGR00725 family protein [Chlorogloeopsis fritschii PCC 9212]|uniref:TIGR00725 family protein n=1 Tax=Chlorogloeopsis fritschii PCC 6912 TaxID=211165 RepID=A0A3S0ZUF9_CHLFR|nr:TIGR00725 family protein [Chlorogloeopsis fritschii]MBF2006543.1 TIGR00725 family protein [Chlorogloeopsis fritschii C42_A2020_084]RUR77826.1 TIGR00725 family protein [Chlorogloeopsis fritschii PCC 6912]